MTNPFSRSFLHLRPRSVWEAADSGVLILRDSFAYFIPLFIIPVGIIGFSLFFLFDVLLELTFLPYIALWWLKPLFDRPMLHIISRRFFNAKNQKEGRSGIFRGIWGNIGRGLLGDLLWRRFSYARSARMPILILERARGKQYSMRKTILADGGLNFCFFISVFGLMLELTLLAGEYIFCIMINQLLPEYMPGWGIWHDSEAFLFALFCFNFAIVESLYVCSGFGIYINSRVEVEGWDLQILFQKFAGSKSISGEHS